MNWNELGIKNYKQYISAKPFPHIILDNIFNNDELSLVEQAFPSKNDIDWYTFGNLNEIKLACNDEGLFPPRIKEFIRFLNSQTFVGFLENLTGIENLIVDQSLEGAGMHQIMPGGLLKIHSDFMKHPKNKLDRRLNVLVYLNKDWREEYGGHFELWNKDMSKAEVKILPTFNRLAVFSTNATSNHGHPNPLSCPPGMSRKSIAMYYYTNGRPQEDGNSSYSTWFKARKGTNDKYGVLKEKIKRFIPPVFFRGLK